MSPDSTVESVQGRILAGLETVHKHWGYFLASGIAFLVLDDRSGLYGFHDAGLCLLGLEWCSSSGMIARQPDADRN